MGRERNRKIGHSLEASEHHHFYLPQLAPGLPCSLGPYFIQSRPPTWPPLWPSCSKGRRHFLCTSNLMRQGYMFTERHGHFHHASHSPMTLHWVPDCNPIPVRDFLHPLHSPIGTCRHRIPANGPYLAGKQNHFKSMFICKIPEPMITGIPEFRKRKGLLKYEKTNKEVDLYYF